ncbi:MAG: D-alanyl-D-alanine carboxypeptidase family protein [Armatimonadota bacterium]
MTRFTVVFLLITFIAAVMPLQAEGSLSDSSSLVQAKAAILMDRQTSLVLWEKNADEKLPMASTTKIMTAIVILEHGKERLGEEVTVSANAFATGGSSVFKAGDRTTLENLLKAILIQSSNEASVAAAEYLAGSEKQFVAWMNAKAKELGLRHTHFVNCHGLYDRKIGAQHYSTARDLAVIAQYALTYHPEIRKIIVMGNPKPVGIDVVPRGRVLLWMHNRGVNKEVPGIPGSRIDGVKTGFVKESGKCLVSSATLNRWQLIAVVLNSPDYFNENNTLLHYGFSRFEWKKYADTTMTGTSVPVSWGAQSQLPVGTRETFGAPIPKLEFGQAVNDEVRFEGNPLKAPVQKGQVVGRLVLYRDGQKILYDEAIALADVPVAGWVRFLRGIGFTVFGIVLMAFAGKLYGKIAKTHRRRRRRLATASRNADYGRPGDGQW